MDRKYIDDHHIVARYLADQLSEQERTAFEALCLQHQDLVQEMEATARVKLGLARLRVTGELAAEIRRPLWYERRFQVAAAAIALLAIGSVRIAVRLPEVQPMLAANPTELPAVFGGARSVVDTYSVLRMRGGTRYDLEMEQPARGELVEWRVLSEYSAVSARYRVTLASLSEDGSAAKIAELRNLESAADGYVAVFVNGVRLRPGVYQLVLTVDPAPLDRSESRYLIRVR